MTETDPPSSSPQQPTERGSRTALLFVVLVVLIDMIGFGIIMPVFPALIQDVTGDSLGAAAIDAGWLTLTFATLQFLFAPIVGNLSDRFGRRPILLISMLGYSISFTLMGLAPTLLLIFVGRIVTGITGASFSAANAYIADVTPPEKRSQNFGLVGMAFGVGFIIGPALGGLLGEWGTRVPFYAAGALALGNFTLGFFFLKESLPQEKRRPFNLLRANAVTALKGLSGQNPVILWYAAAMAWYWLGHMVYPVVFAFYGIAAFGWSEAMVGLSLAFVGLGAAIVQGGLIRLVIPRVGERNAAIIGIASMFVAMQMLLWARTEWLAYAAIALGSLQGLVQPSINGLMSKAVSDDTQGELQGANSSLSSLASMISPMLFTGVFFAFTKPGTDLYLPGAPFGVASIIGLVALAIFLCGYRLQQRRVAGADASLAGVTPRGTR